MDFKENKIGACRTSGSSFVMLPWLTGLLLCTATKGRYFLDNKKTLKVNTFNAFVKKKHYFIYFSD